MKAQRYHSLGLAVLSSALVLLSLSNNVVAMSSSSGAPATGCTDAIMTDGDCDLDNNTEECGYDGGDCCDCTCVDTAEYVCGVRSGFSCLDPSASCFVDDESSAGDDATTPSTSTSTEEETTTTTSTSTSTTEEEPTATTSTSTSTIEVPTATTSTSTSTEEEEDLVEAGTKTTISTSANAFDERPGAASGGSGCQADGCGPELTRDGVTDAAAESRWSCVARLVPDGMPCAIEFVFEDPQDIMDVEVAFFKGDERTRTVEVSMDGEVIGEVDSYPGSTFNSLGFQGVGVETLTITSVGLTENDWLSFSEVRFLVEP